MKLYGRNFGCEFEFSSEFEEMKTLSQEIIPPIYGKHKLKVTSDWIRSNNNKEWHLKPDATTNSELVTPISSYKDINKIP